MIWLDAHLSPRLALWIREQLGHEAQALRDLGLRDAEDEPIFSHARSCKAIVMTKDSDFVDLLHRMGPPPQVIWLRCGNTSEERLKQILSKHLNQALAYLQSGEPLVEIQ
jgi:predicted nuclease of predicted toxin-antitoxin system